MLLKGKTAVITGCNRGIGKAILEDMAKHGADVFAVVRRENKEFTTFCQEMMAKYEIHISEVYADFSKEEEVKEAARTILASKKQIDILVNNIGMANSLNMFTMIGMETIRTAFDVNFFSGFMFTQLISKSMMRYKSGSIIFISSSAAFDGGANVEYSASKAAIIGETRRIALELGKFGIRVNSVAPGLTETDMGNSMSAEDEAIAISRNIMKRKGKPDEIADVVVFLASEMSRFMTGQIVRVDGGLI